MTISDERPEGLTYGAVRTMAELCWFTTQEFPLPAEPAWLLQSQL